MLLNVQLIASLGQRLYGRETGRLAAGCFATAAAPVIVGRLAITDALLLLIVLSAALALIRMAQRGATAEASCALWITIALAVLTKGPAALVFLAALVFALQRTWPLPWRSIRFWSGVPLGLLIAVPWHVYVATHAGPALREQWLWFEIASRFVSPPHGHTGPPGYHGLVMLAGWFPWSVLIPGALLDAWRARRGGDRSAAMLALWFMPAWAFLELMPSKLPHYSLPLFVPLAVLLGRTIELAAAIHPTADTRRVLRAWAMVGAMVAGALLLYALSDRLPAPLRVASLVGPVGAAHAPLAFVALFVFAGPGLAPLVARAGILPTVRWIAGATAAAWLVIGTWLLPALEPYRLSRAVASSARAMAEETPGPVTIVAYGFSEPTMFFYLPLGAREIRDAAGFAAGERIVIADERSELPAVLGGAFERRTLFGINYVNGRATTVRVIRTATEEP
jgi:4-amino-4-deoxy-L-arabinose transferase-like glycosyltransferase